MKIPCTTLFVVLCYCYFIPLNNTLSFHWRIQLFQRHGLIFFAALILYLRCYLSQWSKRNELIKLFFLSLSSVKICKNKEYKFVGELNSYPKLGNVLIPLLFFDNPAVLKLYQFDTRVLPDQMIFDPYKAKSRNVYYIWNNHWNKFLDQFSISSRKLAPPQHLPKEQFDWISCSSYCSTGTTILELYYRLNKWVSKIIVQNDFRQNW